MQLYLAAMFKLMTVLRFSTLIFCILVFFVSNASAASSEDPLLAPLGVCSNVSLQSNQAEQQKSILCLTNFSRQKVGLSALQQNFALNNSSAIKVNDIINCKNFAHVVCGKDFGSSFKQAGFYNEGDGYQIGENLAMSFGTLYTREAVNMWLKSPGHRANLLSADWNQLGSSAAFNINTAGYGGVGGSSSLKSSFWVQQFGAVEKSSDDFDVDIDTNENKAVTNSSTNYTPVVTSKPTKKKPRKYCKKKPKKGKKATCKKKPSSRKGKSTQNKGKKR